MLIYPRDKQYRGLLNFKRSGRSKKIPASVWIYIRDVLKKRDRDGKQSDVLWDGDLISKQKTQNEVSRYRLRHGCLDPNG